jgi:hypothetical protein
MECKCPFISLFEESHTCVYMGEGGICDQIDINPGNGDAWCSEMIELGIEYMEGGVKT